MSEPTLREQTVEIDLRNNIGRNKVDAHFVEWAEPKVQKSVRIFK